MFKKITLKEKDLYYKYIEKDKFLSCEYSFATLFMWKDFNNIEYDIINNVFIIRKYDKNNGFFFMEPLGFKNNNDLIKIINYLNKIKDHDKGKWLFGNVRYEFIKKLKPIFKDKLLFSEEIDKFDYIYKFCDLLNLSGIKFKNKRNKYNQFVKNYNYKIKYFRTLLDDKEREECLEFLDKWSLENIKKNEEFLAEIDGSKNLINHLEELDLDLIKLYVDNKLIGLSIGENFNDKIYIIHVEKCLREFKGSYSFLNNELLKKYPGYIKYINREEDLGIAGLREAKMSYNPCFLERKYLFKIE